MKQQLKSVLSKIAPDLLFRLQVLNYHRYEPEMWYVKALCDPAKSSLDIGAAYGYYAYLLSLYSRTVYAFEPNPAYLDNLQRFVGERAKIECLAISDKCGTFELRVPVYGANVDLARATLEQNVVEQFVESTSVEVRMKRLDDLGINNVGFIKIDVEGHELSVLEGGPNLLQSDRPNLLIEIELRHMAGNLREVQLLLGKNGYKGYFLSDGRVHPLVDFDKDRHQNLNQRKKQYVNNFFFLPESAISQKLATLRVPSLLSRLLHVNRRMV